jgi:agmatinase
MKEFDMNPEKEGDRHYAGEPWFGAPRVDILPVPYDGTSTWGKGADRGPAALFEALENMELYDIETDTEVHREGIRILPALQVIENDRWVAPELMCDNVEAWVNSTMEAGRTPVLIGGEHSVSIGAIRAAASRHPNLSVLQLDAHSDLRPEFHGSPCNHACAMHWASQHVKLVQVGIRSTEREERRFEQEHCVIHGDRCHSEPDADWISEAVERLGPTDTPVYITVDLDVFDPSILPETGTPEPGGLNWHQVLALVRLTARQHRIVGFDVVELAPLKEQSPSAFTAAKLLHKMLTYTLDPPPLHSP